MCRVYKEIPIVILIFFVFIFWYYFIVNDLCAKKIKKKKKKRNVIIFGVNMDSSTNLDNKGGKDILILGKGPTQGLIR